MRATRQKTWRSSRKITSWGQRQLQRPSWQRLRLQRQQHRRPELLLQERQVPKRQQQALAQQVRVQPLVRVREQALQQVLVPAQELALPSCRKLRGQRLR